MILSYVIKNNADSDFPLGRNEAWKFIVNVEDEYEAYVQIEKVKNSAKLNSHIILNVYLDGRYFDAREYWTEGANSDDFDYDDSVQIHKIQDETRRR